MRREPLILYCTTALLHTLSINYNHHHHLLYHSTNNTVHSKAQYVDVVASHCQQHEANVFFVKAKRDRKLLYFEEDTAVTALLPRTLHIICRFSIKHSFVSTKIQYTCVLEHRR